MVKRKNSNWMDGFYGLPSGKVDYGEPYLVGAAREAKEEVGVDIDTKDLKFVHFVHRHGENDEYFMDWVDVYYEATKWSGEPYNAEPHKSDELAWVDVEKDADKIAHHQLDAIQNYLKGQPYSEFGWDV